MKKLHSGSFPGDRSIAFSLVLDITPTYQRARMKVAVRDVPWKGVSGPAQPPATKRPATLKRKRDGKPGVGVPREPTPPSTLPGACLPFAVKRKHSNFLKITFGLITARPRSPRAPYPPPRPFSCPERRPDPSFHEESFLRQVRYVQNVNSGKNVNRLRGSTRSTEKWPGH